MNLDRLVQMANQIARNFAAQGDAEAADATARHITAYWDPRMKDELLAGAGDALSPVALRAVSLLRSGAVS